MSFLAWAPDTLKLLSVFLWDNLSTCKECTSVNLVLPQKPTRMEKEEELVQSHKQDAVSRWFKEGKGARGLVGYSFVEQNCTIKFLLAL
uniref:Uncharacterized protein n=1 Tax=Sciurus vulgaris TaxID=55149 RepID=A0A8D2DYR9_SCIVU